MTAALYGHTTSNRRAGRPGWKSWNPSSEGDWIPRGSIGWTGPSNNVGAFRVGLKSPLSGVVLLRKRGEIARGMPLTIGILVDKPTQKSRSKKVSTTALLGVKQLTATDSMRGMYLPNSHTCRPLVNCRVGSSYRSGTQTKWSTLELTPLRPFN
jgi:hypothetical protein